jgi:hypothetical protein
MPTSHRLYHPGTIHSPLRIIHRADKCGGLATARKSARVGSASAELRRGEEEEGVGYGEVGA